MKPFEDWAMTRGYWRVTHMRRSLEAALIGRAGGTIHRCEMCTMPLPFERVSMRAREKHPNSERCKAYLAMGDKHIFIFNDGKPFQMSNPAYLTAVHDAGLPMRSSPILYCKNTTTNDLRFAPAWWIDESVMRGLYEFEKLLEAGISLDMTQIDFLLAWCGKAVPQFAEIYP
jgi:hypothetical protein